MQIGKFTIAQLLAASVLDGKKVKFGFWGGVVSTVICIVFGLLTGAVGKETGAGVALQFIGNVVLGVVLSAVMIGLTFAISGSLGGKKVKGSLWQLGFSKILPMIGVVLLYVIAVLVIGTVEFGLMKLGGVMFWGPLVLALIALPLIGFNLLTVLAVAAGTKLLMASLVVEKGNPWELFVDLNTKIVKNAVKLAANVALMVLTTAPLVAITAALFAAGLVSTMAVSREALQQIMMYATMGEIPFVIIAVIFAAGILAAWLLAMTYVVLYVTAALYSIYLGLDKK